MFIILRNITPTLLGLMLFATPATAQPRPSCEGLLALPGQMRSQYISPALQWIRNQSVNLALDVVGYTKGLPKYLKRNNELRESDQYLQYDNFGEMGLAEMGIAVSYNQEKVAGLNTEKPLIIVANHHLGIVDGLVLQHLSSRTRRNQLSLLFLARWIEKLLPNAIFGDEHGWGTAVPVEINKPKDDDPEYERKMADLKAFNGSWSRKAFRVLKENGALILFPAGQVASINKDDERGYPANVYDGEGTWQEAVINLAKLAKADIVFAHVDAVNSEAFYKHRKRFGGGDKERVIWFFSEALKKSGTSVDVHFSDPLGLPELYERFGQYFGRNVDALKVDSALMAELMRLYTYDVQELFPQELNGRDAPQRIESSPLNR